MSFIDYINNNFALVLILIALLILTHTTVHLSKKMVLDLTAITLYILLLSIVNYIEVDLGNRPTFSYWRTILSAVKYMIPAIMLAQIVITFLNLRNILIFIPAILNSLLCIISIFTGIVFSFSKDNNSFHRGPLGYTPFIVTGIYLFILVFYMFFRSNKQLEDLLPLLFIIGSSVISIIIPIVSWGSFENWFTTSIAVSVFVYYVFIVQQLTKRDVMTGLLNRQSYYADLEKNGDISALISLDMNGLKKLNDTEGHLAGDVALTTLADCFKKASDFGQRVYRVGGDEFMIVCRHCSEDAVKELISKIHENVSKTRYQCSIGYSMYEPGMSLDDLYNKADNDMYKQKQEFYKTHSDMDRRKNR